MHGMDSFTMERDFFLSVMTRWMGNVACIDDMKYAHKIVIRKVEGKRQEGRSWRN